MHHVIIGAGLSAARAIEAIRAAGVDDPITLVGEELELPYNRPPLSKEFLSGALRRDDLLLQPPAFYHDGRIDLRLGRRATRLDTAARVVDLDGGERIAFDRLLVATGAAPRRLEVAGVELANVLYLRTVDDADHLAVRLRAAERVVVVGGGLLGLEVAAAARGLGKKVTVVEAGDTMLGRFAGPLVGRLVTEMHRDQGVDVRTRSTVRAFRGSDTVEEVSLTDGEAVPADLVVIGVGVRPNTGWLAGSGLALDDGALVDEYTATNVPGVFAAGDVARSWNPVLGAYVRLEHYGNAFAQGAAAGRAMIGRPEVHAPLPGASSEQFGRRLQVVGWVRGDERVVVRGDASKRRFTAFFVHDGCLRAAFTLGRPRDLVAAKRLITSRAAVDPAALADAGHELDAVRAPAPAMKEKERP
ncbi:MAG TPA: FAD-dependent oxidoreductase [Polyangiaceae bacterium]|nr:FAD-dependent oxidoreductase [Polyangiaceae bacterium]